MVAASKYASAGETKAAYDRLAKLLQEIARLGQVKELLAWDEETQMPEGAEEARGMQKAALAGVCHEKETSAELGQLISSLEASDLACLDPFERANVRDAARRYRKAVKVSKELAQRMAALESEGVAAWKKSKQAKDPAGYIPVVQKWVEVRREVAAAVDPTADPYDLSIDDFERGMTAGRISAIFDRLKVGLVPLVERVAGAAEKDRAFRTEFLKGPFPKAAQVELGETVMRALGFDTHNGRLDVSAHPCTFSFSHADVRITTRYTEEDFLSSLFGTVHETGHALYEQGRNAEHADEPVNEALSMGVHESQSLLWERMVGQSMAFWRHFGPLVQRTFPDRFGGEKGATPDNFYRAQNFVEKSLIRVEADEVTYPLHIIVRFEIERDLFAGKIRASDLPEVWNEKYRSYLGVVPPDHGVGVLQDIHWPSGAWGYFPSYTLGAMYAAQLVAQAQKEIPDLNAKLAAGEFKVLREWLKEKVHRLGSLHASGDELCAAVTGQPLNPAVFLRYLCDKYGALYGIDLADLAPPENELGGLRVALPQ
eukprot:tig00020614_g12124.t1